MLQKIGEKGAKIHASWETHLEVFRCQKLPVSKDRWSFHTNANMCESSRTVSIPSELSQKKVNCQWRKIHFCLATMQINSYTISQPVYTGVKLGRTTTNNAHKVQAKNSWLFSGRSIETAALWRQSSACRHCRCCCGRAPSLPELIT